ncbi:hypothetical protein XENOCAPTIV_030743 [Xenoophorus captivus]|uniref:Uncharacterized protein n=1 Tax=Xenoophorus captivus TaxID=1517983 RepID=A0ABV0QQ37_9TELE
MVFESCRSDFQSVDGEELLEIMDLHNCRRVPTADNFELLLEELAHQKLIQEPAFVIKQWSTVLSRLRSEMESITAAHENLQPTLRKDLICFFEKPSVLASLNFKVFRDGLLPTHAAAT